MILSTTCLLKSSTTIQKILSIFASTSTSCLLIFSSSLFSKKVVSFLKESTKLPASTINLWPTTKQWNSAESGSLHLLLEAKARFYRISRKDNWLLLSRGGLKREEKLRRKRRIFMVSTVHLPGNFIVRLLRKRGCRHCSQLGDRRV